MHATVQTHQAFDADRFTDQRGVEQIGLWRCGERAAGRGNEDGCGN
jgi:hypothetical protein